MSIFIFLKLGYGASSVVGFVDGNEYVENLFEIFPKRYCSGICSVYHYGMAYVAKKLSIVIVE